MRIPNSGAICGDQLHVQHPKFTFKRYVIVRKETVATISRSEWPTAGAAESGTPTPALIQPDPGRRCCCCCCCEFSSSKVIVFTPMLTPPKSARSIPWMSETDRTSFRWQSTCTLSPPSTSPRWVVVIHSSSSSSKSTAAAAFRTSSTSTSRSGTSSLSSSSCSCCCSSTSRSSTHLSYSYCSLSKTTTSSSDFIISPVLVIVTRGHHHKKQQLYPKTKTAGTGGISRRSNPQQQYNTGVATSEANVSVINHVEEQHFNVVSPQTPNITASAAAKIRHSSLLFCRKQRTSKRFQRGRQHYETCIRTPAVCDCRQHVHGNDTAAAATGNTTASARKNSLIQRCRLLILPHIERRHRTHRNISAGLATKKRQVTTGVEARSSANRSLVISQTNKPQRTPGGGAHGRGEHASHSLEAQPGWPEEGLIAACSSVGPVCTTPPQLILGLNKDSRQQTHNVERFQASIVSASDLWVKGSPELISRVGDCSTRNFDFYPHCVVLQSRVGTSPLEVGFRPSFALQRGGNHGSSAVVVALCFAAKRHLGSIYLYCIFDDKRTVLESGTLTSPIYRLRRFSSISGAELRTYWLSAGGLHRRERKQKTVNINVVRIKDISSLLEHLPKWSGRGQLGSAQVQQQQHCNKTTFRQTRLLWLNFVKLFVAFFLYRHRTQLFCCLAVPHHKELTKQITAGKRDSATTKSFNVYVKATNKRAKRARQGPTPPRAAQRCPSLESVDSSVPLVSHSARGGPASQVKASSLSFIRRHEYYRSSDEFIGRSV